MSMLHLQIVRFGQSVKALRTPVSSAYRRHFRLALGSLCLVALGLLAMGKQAEFTALLTQLRQGDINLHLGWLTMALLLVLPNWYLEASKLYQCLSRQAAITLSQCLRAVLCGVFLGLFTPARLGEYGGRLVPFRDRPKAEVLKATFVGSLSQTVVTVAFGLVGLVYSVQLTEFVGLPTHTLLWVGSGMMAMLILVAFNLSRILKWISQTRLGARLLCHDHVISSRLLLKVIGLSAVRYVLYSLQYVIVLVAFGAELPLLALYGGVTVTYLIQTLLPIPPLSSLVGRVGVAALVFSMVGVPAIVVLSATLTLWIINLLAPAFLGVMVMTSQNPDSHQMA